MKSLIDKINENRQSDIFNLFKDIVNNFLNDCNNDYSYTKFSESTKDFRMYKKVPTCDVLIDGPKTGRYEGGYIGVSVCPDNKLFIQWSPAGWGPQQAIEIDKKDLKDKLCQMLVQNLNLK